MGTVLEKKADGAIVVTTFPDPVPASVTPLQVRKAIRQLGLTTQVANYVLTLTEERKEAWEYADAIPRSHGLVVEAAAAMGWTEAQTDALFKLAVTL